MREPDIQCEWLTGVSDGSEYRAMSCGRPAAFIGFGGTEHPGYARAFCAAHAKHAQSSDRWLVRIEPICRDPRPISLFCGALAGALDAKLCALIADYIAHGDPQALLDLAEQRGLHEGGYGPERYEEWEELDAHGEGDNPHVWLPVHREADGRRWISPVWKRCPCGEYEGDDGRPWRRVAFHPSRGTPARQ